MCLVSKSVMLNYW